MSTSHSIGAKLDAARRELLDLSGRNRLINTQRGAGRSSRLEIADERSDEIYHRLVHEGKAVGFLPAPEPPAVKPEVGANQSALVPASNSKTAPTAGNAVDEVEARPLEVAQAGDIESGGEVPQRQRDAQLQTLLQPEVLEKVLLRLYYDARTYEEEQGVNILYLAVGFLKYYEDDRSAQPRYAPLVLIPVTLERSSAGARFRLFWTQGDVETNLSLQELLKQTHGLELPDVPPGDELTPSAYFATVAAAVSSKRTWEVLPNDVVLWFFSFSKFLMYRDLDPETWPAERRLESSELVKSLLAEGFRTEGPIIGSDQNVDELLTPLDMVHVLDADSSQTLAIEEIRRGANLVIQGPPGTGKSQTIANVIARAVRDGKRVLFVAEKMAALEVVKRRLDNVGLGDMCLELHSHKANKRAVIGELSRVLALSRQGAPRTAGIAQQAERLRERRDQLNRHAAALHAPVTASGVTAYEALGELVRLRAAGLSAALFALPSATQWSRDDLERKRGLVADLARHIERLGKPADHPWRGVRAKGLLPSDIAGLLQKTPQVLHQLKLLQTAGIELAIQLSSPAPETPQAVSELTRAAQHVGKAPSMSASAIANPVWDSSRGQIDALVSHGAAWAAARATLEPLVVDSAWEADVADIRKTIKAWGNSWFRWLSGKYRNAARALSALLKGKPPRTAADSVALLDKLTSGQAARRAVVQDDGGMHLGRRAFGEKWAGLESDWGSLQSICAWERKGRDANLTASFRRLYGAMVDRAAVQEQLSKIRELLLPAIGGLKDAVAPLELDASRAFSAVNLNSATFAAIERRLDAWQQGREDLAPWVSYATRAEKLEAEGLAELGRLIDESQLAPSEIGDHFSLAFYEAILRESMRLEPELAAFDGLSHEQLIQTFRDLDTERLRLARQEVAYVHYQGLPPSGGVGEAGVISHEANKKRNHLPIRRLLSEAGHAVQALKPVFMMSPISVAQYLAPGVLTFDLLVIDEASQVEPVDALGSIARSNQIAIVGDDRQLPPTRFFAKLAEDDAMPSDEEIAAMADIESVLGLCRARGVRDRMLRWHYRSRHQSLIAVSNHEFYEDKLYVVPSPQRHSEKLGLRFHHIKMGVFDRGKSATNRVEAAAVADAVIEHGRDCPSKTLGVGAFSVAQRDAILDELERRRRERPELEPFFASGAVEPFFVKNLENIQGDERDVIFISVGYGRDANGYMAMNFGPLNNDGGERRLNVLISRARERCEVFSSITADDIDLARGRSWGVRALKTFLLFANHGQLDVAWPTESEFESEFERQVARAIEGLGYTVHPQVGLGGFRMDLAVVDPAAPGRYLLGIECDGARYHSSRSARDRDRLREQVLSDRGWVIHRVWSTDWFREPEAALRRAAAAIEGAKQTWAGREREPDDCQSAAPVPGAGSEAVVREAASSRVSAGNSLTTPYVEANFKVNSSRDIPDTDLKELAAVVAKVIEIEGPVHGEEVARRVARLWGVQRTGSRIVDAINSALDELIRQEVIDRFGEFFSPSGQAAPPVRDRSDTDSPGLLKPEYLPPSEISAAVVMLVDRNYGVTSDEAVSETAKLLGSRRATAPLRAVIEAEIQRLVTAGDLEVRQDKLYTAKATDSRPQPGTKS